MESKVHQMLGFQSNKHYFFESIQNLSMLQPAEFAGPGN